MTRSSGDPQQSMTWPLVSGVLTVVLLVLIVIALSGLIGGGGSDTTPTPSGSPGASQPPSAAGSAGPSTAPSAGPSGGGSAPPSSQATSATSPAATAPAGASGSPDATACSGSDANRTFFAQAADALSFEVYCAVLPSGWSLVSGSYRGASGGRLEVAYRGPGGATLRLREGPAACGDDPTCPPTGTGLGEASFGDQPATISGVDEGYAIVATDPAVPYIVQTTGLDQAGSEALAAALITVR